MPSVAVFFLVLLPWLNPFASGPQPAVVQQLLSWACGAGLLAICARYRSPQSIDRWAHALALGWLAAALVSALLALLQYFGHTAALEPWVNHADVGEAYANLRQRNQFATLTNIGLAVAAQLGTITYRRTSASIQQRTMALCMASAVLLATANAAASSRTGLAQLLLLGLLGFGGGWPARRVLLVAALAYAVAVFALPQLAGLDAHRVGMLARLREGDVPCASRLTLWSNVLHLIAQKPWLGWGWGELDYAHFMTLYPGARFCEILDNAHNLPLHVAVELGVPVAVSACLAGLWLVARARPWQESDATRQLAWAVLAVIVLHSLVEYPLWYGPFQMAVAGCVWLVWGFREDRGDRQNLWLNRSLGPVLCAWAAIIIIVFVVFAGWNYWRVSQLYLPATLRASGYQDSTAEKVRNSWFFQDQVRFAELTTTELTRNNADHLNTLAREMLHFSPEPRVVEKCIESAVMLGRDDEALFFLRRFKAAFPQEHAHWAEVSGSRKNAAQQPLR